MKKKPQPPCSCRSMPGIIVDVPWTEPGAVSAWTFPWLGQAGALVLGQALLLQTAPLQAACPRHPRRHLSV